MLCGLAVPFRVYRTLAGRHGAGSQGFDERVDVRGWGSGTQRRGAPAPSNAAPAVIEIDRSVLAPVAAGLVAGAAGAVAAGRALSSLLFGVTAHDPVSLAVVTVTLALAAAIASYLPARRAGHVDPVIALRAE